ncbi:hypothetical protein H4S07_005566, partial [Coemansia furcata]
YNGGNRINAWYSPEFIQSVLSRSTRMSDLRPAIEFSLHGAVHIAMGGDMVQNYSPNDFVFWLHHANIDRIWSVWQTMNPNQNFWSMDGVDNTGRPMTYNTPIPHYNDPTINIIRLGMNNMCYFYDNGNTISNKRRSLLERRGSTKKCIPRPLASLPPLPPLVEGVFNNVNILPVPADTYVQATIAQKLPPVVLDKWFPSFTGGASPNVTTGGAPNAPASSSPYGSVTIPAAPVIPDVTIPKPPAYSNLPPPYSCPSSSSDSSDYRTDSTDSSDYGSESDSISFGSSVYGSSSYGSSSHSSVYGSESDSNSYGSSVYGSSSHGSSSYSNVYGSESESNSHGSSSDSSLYSESGETGYKTSSEENGAYSSSESSSGPYTASPLPSDSSSSLYSSSVSSSSSSVYSEAYHVFDPSNETEAKGLKYPMPNPFPMTEHFIKMHNYPVSEIHKQYLIAREFVRDMNAAGYQSPFAKGATA